VTRWHMVEPVPPPFRRAGGGDPCAAAQRGLQILCRPTLSRAAQPFIATLDNAPKRHNAQRVKHDRVSPYLQATWAGVWAVTQLTGAFCRLRRKGTGSPAPPQRGAPLTLGAAPTGAADSLPPAGAERGAQGSPNCVKDEFYGGACGATNGTISTFWRL
jgi:hypothetical protein